MRNPRPKPAPAAAPVPYGVTIAGRAALLVEDRGDPLAPFPALALEGQAYNCWLAAQILDPVLSRWSRDALDQRPSAATAAADVEWACARARWAFQEVLPAAAALGDAAVLAALGVTANLQRTLALLAEFILDDPADLHPREPLRLSRRLCGLVDYPEYAPYFPGRIHPPVHAGRLRLRRRDPRILGNALWCSAKEIDRGCDEALAVLGREIRRAGHFTPADLRHLTRSAVS